MCGRIHYYTSIIKRSFIYKRVLLIDIVSFIIERLKSKAALVKNKQSPAECKKL